MSQQWIIRWKTYTGDRIECGQYNEGATDFPDIVLEYFRQAVRLIETNCRALRFQSFF